MRYIIHAIIAAIVLVGLQTAHADQSANESGEKKKTYKKTQSVDFEGSDVDGIVRSPDGAYLSQRKTLKFLPLYNVKKNFDKDIKSSVEYMR